MSRFRIGIAGVGSVGISVSKHAPATLREKISEKRGGVLEGDETV